MSGLMTMIRLILRRDRVKLPLWIIGFVASLIVMIPLLGDMYGDEASLQAMHSTVGTNPAGLFMTGPMDEPTIGAFMVVETLIWWGIVIAFINATLVVRHTRHNEEIGAQELLLSGQLHRASSLVAALTVALGVNVVIALGIGLGMEAMSPEWSTTESWLYAVAMGLFGFAWAAIAAVVVQLVESSRSATSMLASLIGVGFILRGIGDFMGKVDSSGIHQPSWVSSLSPYGWLQATRPLTEPDWAPLLIPIVFSVVAMSLGFLLLMRRDVGAGLLPSGKGKLRATKFLASPLGLAVYLQKGTFIGWLVAVIVMVATISIMVPQMSDMFSSSENLLSVMEAIGGTGALVPMFMSAMMAITCVMVFAYAIHGLGRLRGEEASGHLESLLATKLSRFRWIGLHAGIIFIGGVIMLAITGLGLATLTNLLSDYNLNSWEYMWAALSYTPVMLAFIGLYLLLFGLLPRLAGGVAWLYFGFVVFALWLGPIVKLDQSIMNLSLLEHLAAPPAEAIKIAPLFVVTAVSLVAIVVGLIAWRQRNLLEK